MGVLAETQNLFWREQNHHYEVWECDYTKSCFICKHNLLKPNINPFTCLQEYHSINVTTNIGAVAIFLMSLIYILSLNVLLRLKSIWAY